MSIDSQWYYAKGEQQSGPVPLSRMRDLAAAGSIDRDTLVWTETMQAWQPLRETELAAVLIKAPPPPLPPSRPPMPPLPAQAAVPSLPSELARAPGPAAAALPQVQPLPSPNPARAAAAPLPQPNLPQPNLPQAQVRTLPGAAAFPSAGMLPPTGALPPGPAYGVPYGAPYGESPGFGRAIKICLSKYATFAGRATRSEFWWFNLFYVLLITLVTGVAFMIPYYVAASAADYSDDALNTAVIAMLAVQGIAILAFALPQLAVTVRRLHDTDRSGWFYWVTLIPAVGPIILLVFLCQGGTRAPNRFG